MKKLILLLLLLVCISASAQKPQSHLKFAKIDITGNPLTLVQKLQEKGYVQTTGTRDNINYYLLDGKFSGVEDCRVFVFHSSNTGNVYRIEVSFPDYIQNGNRYTELKDAYSVKYGNATEDRYYDVSFGKQMVCSTWNTPQGTIKLFYGGQTVLYVKYTDKINNEAHNKSKIGYEDI